MSEASEAQDQFFKLRELIFKNTGLDLSRYKENYLKRRIAARMRALGVDSYGAYAAKLGSDAGEYDRLLDRVTVNVTEFFRDRDVYDELAELVMAKIAKGQRSLAVWSAGCSSGEEPYSLAMTFERLRKEGLANFNYSVLATDLDEACLQRAKRGHYPKAAAQKLDPWYLKHCLAGEGEEPGPRTCGAYRRRVGAFCVRARMRSRSAFRRMNPSASRCRYTGSSSKVA